VRLTVIVLDNRHMELPWRLQWTCKMNFVT
jgi:hypothetical protein